MKAKFFLADENIDKLGLGDLVNRFSSIKTIKDRITTILIRHSKNSDALCHEIMDTISDITKNKNVVIINNLKQYPLHKTKTLASNELNPTARTELIFSSEELIWAKKIIEQVGINKDENILAICNSVPRITKRKMWPLRSWIALIDAILQAKPQTKIVLLPSFRVLSDKSDFKIKKYFSEIVKDIEIVSFHEFIEKNLSNIVKDQKIFGKNRNDKGFSLRQFGSLVHLILSRNNVVGVFNDSAPAHIAVAALGKKMKSGKIISVNVEQMNNYRLRNNGKSFPLKYKFIKSSPSVVANFIIAKLQ